MGILKKIRDKIQPDVKWSDMDSPLMTSKELKKFNQLLRAFYHGYRMNIEERNAFDIMLLCLAGAREDQRTKDKDIYKKRIMLICNGILYKIYELLGGDD